VSLSSAARANPEGLRRPPGVRLEADATVSLDDYVLAVHRSPSSTGASSVRGRWATIREPATDATVAVAVWAVMAYELTTRPLEPGQSPSTWVAYLLTGCIAAPLVIHRRYPVVAMAVSVVATVAYSWGRYAAYPGYALFILVFVVALHTDRRRALIVYLGSVVGLGVALLLQPAEVATASAWISTVLTVTVAWLGGENLRSRGARRHAELDEARSQAEQKAEEARRAISAERLRIARDLHDVVAHSMSVIAVQAGVAHHVVDERPEVARDALASIELVAREGLVEMRRLLGLLRSESEATDGSGTTPVEGLRDVDRLLEQFRAAGVRVETSGLGDVGDLPPALDITAYRIVQEGLTNVLRHGGPVAYLTVQRQPAELRIEIRDEGRPSASPPATPGSGHGLTGIRERVALFGGTVHTEARAQVGFRLVVKLPTTAWLAAR
jgi:signal transduction histidine kinase